MLKIAFELLSPAGSTAKLSTLIFHRVLPAADALFPEEVDAARFDQICRWLKQWFNVLPLDEAVTLLNAGSLPARAAAITFDDGYADNHDVALPILLRHRLPATFFIATSFLDGGRMWNDRVIEAFRSTSRVEADLADVELGIVRLASVAERRQAIDATLRAIKYRPQAERADLVGALERKLEVAPSSELMMRSSQVRKMFESGMQIGAHTQNHPILASTPSEDAYQEIVGSKKRLEELIDAPITLFAYPNGKFGKDYKDEHAEMARKAGFSAALATDWGAAHRGTDRYRIPRFTPWDRTPMRFAARMMGNLRRAN